MNWPEEHRRVYAAAAEAAGLSESEYVLRLMAALHGVIKVDGPGLAPRPASRSAESAAPDGRVVLDAVLHRLGRGGVAVRSSSPREVEPPRHDPGQLELEELDTAVTRIA